MLFRSVEPIPHLSWRRVRQAARQLQVERELRRQRLEAKMILQIHDELVLEVPKEEVDVAKQLLRTAMENVIHLDVPLVVNLAVSANLAKV